MPIALRRRGLVVALLVVVAGVAAAIGLAGAAPAKPGITLQVSPASQSVERGKNAAYTVTVSSSNGFAGQVSLGVSGLPSGATSSWQPAAVSVTASGSASSATAVLTVSTASATPVGSSTLTITGTSGKVSGSVTAGLTVNYPISSTLSMTASPSTATVSPGSVAVYSVALTRNGVSGNVSFGVVGGLPSGASASYSPNPTTGNSSTLQVSTTSSTPDGTSTLNLVASGKDAGGTTRYAYASVQLVVKTTVRAFTISGDLAGALAPGVTLPLELQLTNPNDKAVSIDNLSVSIQEIRRTTSAISQGLACTKSDYAVAQYSGPYPLSMPGQGTRSLSQLGIPPSQWPHVGMVNRPVNQDGCKGATITLSYSGSGRGA